MTDVDVVAPDPADARLALRASGVLAEFNRAGVLTAADVHVAMRLGALAGVDRRGRAPRRRPRRARARAWRTSAST